MDYEEKIIVKKENLQKLQEKLKEIKLMTQDEDIQSKVNEMLGLLGDELKPRNVLLEKMIKEKMIETKHSNPELHFKLYMLHRKLVEGKIDEEEAMKAYEVYVIF